MGVFVAIEGGDGSGKRTQTELLAEYAKKVFKRNVFLIAFPRHGEASSYYADQYLNGSYGGINEVHADLASLPYALDRFAAKGEIAKYLADPKGLIIADRYVASNMAHQGAKFANKKDRLSYYQRILHTEYDILGIPKPDLNIILLVPSLVAQNNIDKKEKRVYTDRTRDIHEEDAGHLDRTKANYEELAKLYPEWFRSVDCMNATGKMRSRDSIQKELRARLKEVI